MSEAGGIALRLHALRAARARQLRARATRPLRRCLTRAAPAPRLPVPAGGRAAALWRSRAYAGCDGVVSAPDGSIAVLGLDVAFPPADWSLPGEPRLRRFHLLYGDETLGWARAGDAAALARARAGIEAWIAACPPGQDDAWHPYPLATRILNWVGALTLEPVLAATPGLADSLWRQLAVLARNVENEVLGNHVVRDAAALALGGVAFADPRLRERGLTLLRRELPEQVLPDGGHYERSPAYHLVVLRDLLLVRAATGERFLDAPVERMSRFAAALATPDGAPAPFNDCFAKGTPELDLPPPPAGVAAFPDTGYVVVRDGPLWLAFDCGPCAPRFLPAHAHADALSLQLWWAGQPVLVDPGTSTYEPGPIRDRERSTLAHSTVTVDGRSQFAPWGAFRSGPLPRVALVEAAPGRLVAEARHAGLLHRRTVTWEAGEVHVRDRVEASRRGSRSPTERLLESRLVWSPQPPPGVALQVDGGGEQALEQGAVADGPGRVVPVRVSVVRLEAPLPAEIGWRLRAEGDSSPTV